VRNQLRVPREDLTLYAVPPLAAGLDIASRNRQSLEESALDIQGRSLPRLRQWSREQVLQAAREYTATWAGADNLPAEYAADAPVFVSGHQPSLFHPGVWIKNFALGRLAEQAGAVGLNLVVDNDTFATTSIRAPAGGREQPHLISIPFDEARPVQPWEDARIVNRPTFEQFGQRVSEAMAPWGIDPVVRELWPAAVAHSAQSDRLADCLTAARNRLERQWGTANLELPISRLCQLDPFFWFASHLLAHLPRFLEVHNEALREYRVVNRIRSRTHPVADLQRQGDWCEAPFWIWKAGDLHRARLYARQAGREVLLSDGSENVLARLPLTPQGEACCAVEVLRELTAGGVHLRTRALTTTLFSRLCLGDLFLHGIGGAKYDEMTDRIIARFFGLPAPGFLTVSGTLLLPLDPHPVVPEDEIRLRRLLRDLERNPEQHLAGRGESEIAALLAEERRLITEQDAAHLGTPERSARQSQRQQRYESYSKLRDVKQKLAEFTRTERARIAAERETVLRQLQANQILRDREFSYCLYPAEKLRQFTALVRD
jgi:hypothetical protein